MSTCVFLVSNEDKSDGKLIVPQFATSSTSFAIGTGSKAFTTSAGLTISTTQRYRVYSLGNPANWMAGKATYSGTTFTLTVDATGGSGTFTDWQIAPEVRLWPGQQMWIFAQNNVWFVGNPTRWKLSAETAICADPGGNDSGDGLNTSRCFAKIQTAVDIVYREWDANNFAPDIDLYGGGSGIFNEAVTMQGQITGYNFIRFRTKAANTWQNTVACLTYSDNAEVIADATYGFTQTWNCNTSNSAAIGTIYGHQLGVADISGAHNWRPGGTNDSFLKLDGEGRATINGTGAGIILGNGGTVGNSAYAYVNCDYHCAGVTTGGTLSYSGNLSLAAFYIGRAGSVIDHSANPTNTAGTGTIGPALILGGSVLRLNGLVTTNIGGTPTTSPAGVCATTC
ncbi:hypothetical protein ACRAVF_27325 [Bradyrhizobium oligotrophicum S58]